MTQRVSNEYKQYGHNVGYTQGYAGLKLEACFDCLYLRCKVLITTEGAGRMKT